MSNCIYSVLEFSLTKGLAEIVLNRPESANGFNIEMSEELAHVAKRVADDDSVKAVILTGNGKFFSAGGDIKSMVSFGDDVASGIKIIADNLHQALALFMRMPAPLIVAVNGTAAGAGFSTAVVGDLVLASEQAKFTMAYTNIGLSPDGGASYLIPRLIGLRRTQELMFTNRVLNACEAKEWGLVNRVLPAEELMKEARELAAKFITGAKGSNASIKRLLLTTWDNSPEAQMDFESAEIAHNAGSSDGQEGIQSFIEKRAPEFK